MAISVTYTMSIKNNDGILEATSEYVVSADAVERFSVVAPSSGNVVVPFTLDISTCNGFWVESDQEVTFEENAAVNFTVLLSANRAYYWAKEALLGFTATNPMGSTDAVTLKFVNAGSTNANVKGAFFTT